MVSVSISLCDALDLYAVVHRTPVVNLPSMKGQVPYVDLLWSESSHDYVMKMAFALFGLCMEDLLLTLRQGGSRYSMWSCF